MIMENAENAYVMHIPDRHPGILNPKYGIEGIYVNENVWRDPITININPKEITKVKVIDFINEGQSYTINIEQVYKITIKYIHVYTVNVRDLGIILKPRNIFEKHVNITDISYLIQMIQ